MRTSIVTATLTLALSGAGFRPCGFVLSHPWRDETASRMEHPALVQEQAVGDAALGVRPQVVPARPPVPPPEARVDINHATIEQLLKVPGMTRSWAGRIVRFRPYRTKQDLLEHGVVSSGVYARIKDYIIAHREAQ